MKTLTVPSEQIRLAVESHLRALSLINDNDIVDSVAFAGRDEFYVYLKKDNG